MIVKLTRIKDVLDRFKKKGDKYAEGAEVIVAVASAGIGLLGAILLLLEFVVGEKSEDVEPATPSE